MAWKEILSILTIQLFIQQYITAPVSNGVETHYPEAASSQLPYNGEKHDSNGNASEETSTADSTRFYSDNTYFILTSSKTLSEDNSETSGTNGDMNNANPKISLTSIVDYSTSVTDSLKESTNVIAEIPLKLSDNNFISSTTKQELEENNNLDPQIIMASIINNADYLQNSSSTSKGTEKSTINSDDFEINANDQESEGNKNNLNQGINSVDDTSYLVDKSTILSEGTPKYFTIKEDNTEANAINQEPAGTTSNFNFHQQTPASINQFSDDTTNVPKGTPKSSTVRQARTETYQYPEENISNSHQASTKYSSNDITNLLNTNISEDIYGGIETYAGDEMSEENENISVLHQSTTVFPIFSTKYFSDDITTLLDKSTTIPYDTPEPTAINQDKTEINVNDQEPGGNENISNSHQRPTVFTIFSTKYSSDDKTNLLDKSTIILDDTPKPTIVIPDHSETNFDDDVEEVGGNENIPNSHQQTTVFTIFSTKYSSDDVTCLSDKSTTITDDTPKPTTIKQVNTETKVNDEEPEENENISNSNKQTTVYTTFSTKCPSDDITNFSDKSTAIPEDTPKPTTIKEDDTETNIDDQEPEENENISNSHQQTTLFTIFSTKFSSDYITNLSYISTILPEATPKLSTLEQDNTETRVHDKDPEEYENISISQQTTLFTIFSTKHSPHDITNSLDKSTTITENTSKPTTIKQDNTETNVDDQEPKNTSHSDKQSTGSTIFSSKYSSDDITNLLDKSTTKPDDTTKPTTIKEDNPETNVDHQTTITKIYSSDDRTEFLDESTSIPVSTSITKQDYTETNYEIENHTNLLQQTTYTNNDTSQSTNDFEKSTISSNKYTSNGTPESVKITSSKAGESKSTAEYDSEDSTDSNIENGSGDKGDPTPAQIQEFPNTGNIIGSVFALVVVDLILIYIL